ncbi:lipoate---protein ligase [Ketogulonicigenium robustum]|uniref:Lipoate---protein ligase n=1 Tax=Ketogulonicigenium robustum TaxID=92947 RepID=A0A1W6P180_9RHOB|nr:lipoate--protein ligase family protein [Ketogulonicigenium robustum]ARO15199.1 lipoate---protein ligase [Ketogulonicigenium robustum]
MHGEYKVPGGKLVVADLTVADDKLVDVHISGDFFLEPAEALEDIIAALTGLPADMSASKMTAAIEDGLRPGAALVGFAAGDITTAVRRALGLSKTWLDFDWQIIDGAPESPAMHLALDDVLAREVAAGRRKPTLRFWQWDRPAIIIGNFQSLSNEVDLEAADALGIQTVRRVTGGGAMFVEPGSAITYSLYAPESLVSDLDFAGSYAFLDSWVLKALNALGVDAFYKPLNDITSAKGKIGGAAQKRYSGGVVLHHVTMSYDMDANKMLQVLRIGREKISDKGITSAAKRVDPVRSQTGLSRDAVIDSMKQTFRTLNGGSDGAITPEERAAAENLAETKFSDPAWLRHVP